MANITDSSYSWYGLTNTYNAALYKYDNLTQNFTYSYAAAKQFSLNLNQFKSVIRCLEYARSEFLFEGPIIELSAE
jgi:hypothetical protein